MTNVETRHNEYTFLGSGYSIRTHLLRAAARLRVYSYRDLGARQLTSRSLQDISNGSIEGGFQNALPKKEGDAEREPLIRFVRTGVERGGNAVSRRQGAVYRVNANWLTRRAVRREQSPCGVHLDASVVQGPWTEVRCHSLTDLDSYIGLSSRL
jgi:hypothetical protein